MQKQQSVGHVWRNVLPAGAPGCSQGTPYSFWVREGDPTKLARALITISSLEKPPQRFIAGVDAVGTAEQVAATLRQQTEAYRKLSSSLAYDDAA